MSRGQSWAFAALGLLLPLVAWGLASASAFVDPVVLPGPLQVAERLSQWLFEGELLTDTGISVYRVVAGFALSAVFALPIGLLIGAFRPIEAILDTLRITMGWAWTYLVVAELVAANSGLGFAILKAQRCLKTDVIFGGIVPIGVIGLVMDQGFRWLHRRWFPYLHGRG